MDAEKMPPPWRLLVISSLFFIIILLLLLALLGPRVLILLRHIPDAGNITSDKMDSIGRLLGQAGFGYETLVIIYAILFISLLGLFGLAFKALGIGDGGQAFGLPDGSIRAVMAMGLLAAFIGTVGIIYFPPDQTSSDRLSASVTLSESDRSRLQDQFVILQTSPSENGKFAANLYLRSAPSQDMVRQIFTTVSTALVTIIGFYFGSSGTASAVKAAETAAGARASASDSTEAAAIETEAAKIEIDAATALSQAKEAAAAASEASARASSSPDYETYVAENEKRVAEAQQAAEKATNLSEEIKAAVGKIANQIAVLRDSSSDGPRRQTALTAARAALEKARADGRAILEGRARAEAARAFVLERSPPRGS